MSKRDNCEIPETVEADDIAQLYWDDDGLQRVIDTAIDQTLEIVANQLGVKRYEAGDGSEDFWGDVCGSVINLLREAGIDGPVSDRSEHDDGHTSGELAIEAMRWALEGTTAPRWEDGMCGTAEKRRSKPRVRQLVIAGALIAAEIDRLQRLEQTTTATKQTR